MRYHKQYKKIFFSVIGVLFFTCAIFGGVSAVYAKKPLDKLIVPTKADILREGYPQNQKGMTYGPNVKNFSEPDLILVEPENGTMGYVKQVELTGRIPKNPEEACKLNKQKSYSIPIYLQDGETVIGEFWVGTGGVSET